ncbi:MAG: sugar ABC transporter permease [Acidimicrobiaceae bacterium]|nr:sugar ABC transporter permease [Acidimicrobiaceae bacterium]
MPAQPAAVERVELTKEERRHLSKGARAERKLGFMLIAPSVIVMLAVAGAPMGYAIYLSFNRYDLRFPHLARWIGFANYSTVLENSFWWRAFLITVIITVVSVVIEFVLGMAFALVMHRTLVTRGLIRTFILIPYGLVTVIAAFGWQYAWTPGTGYLANLFGRNHAPLTHTFTAVILIILAEVWKTTPFMSLLLLAGLALVSEDLLKAATIDGATAWQRFTRVILPLMKPAILVALLFRTLDAFRIFDNIYVMTGGANNTGSVSILAYDNLFTGLNLGIGSTISVLIFICVGIIAFLFVKFFGAAAPGSDLEES